MEWVRPIPNAPERSWHASGPIFSPNRRFWTHFGPFLMFLARLENQVWAKTWPGTPNQASRFRNFFLGPIPKLFSASCSPHIQEIQKIMSNPLTRRFFGISRKCMKLCRLKPRLGLDLIFKSGQNHQKWSEMGPEWLPGLGNRPPGMPRPFPSLWDRCRGQKSE